MRFLITLSVRDATATASKHTYGTLELLGTVQYVYLLEMLIIILVHLKEKIQKSKSGLLSSS